MIVYAIVEESNQTYGHGHCGVDWILLIRSGYNNTFSDPILIFSTKEKAENYIKENKSYKRQHILPIEVQ